MSKKKKRIIIITVIILVILIIVAIFNTFPKFNIGKKMLFGKESTNKVYDEKIESIIDTIKVDVDEGIINIINSKDNTISVEVFSDRENVLVKDFDKRLSVIVENKKGHTFPKMNIINIYIPDTFDGVFDINNDYGHIHIDKYKNTNMYINCNFGNVYLEDGNFVRITNKYGDNFVTNTNNLTTIIKWGSLDVKEVNEITTDNVLGTINIGKINKYSNIDLSFGEITIDSITIDKEINKDSYIINDCGDIIINNIEDSENKLTIEAKVGEVKKQ